MSKYYVYVLKSLKDGKRYTGITNDLERRMKDHNYGRNSSTKSRRPLVLEYSEIYRNKMEARQREKYLKSGIGRENLKS